DYTYGSGAHSIDGYTWTLNNADLVTSVNSTADGTASYGYDPTNQLTAASYTGTNAPPNAAYSFDKNGNRDMAGYQVAAGNELASDGTFNYQFDGEGNRTVRTRISNASASDYQTKYAYDDRNRLTDEEYFNNSGTLTKHVHYAYDTVDRQIGEQIDDTGGGTYDRTERFALDGAQPVEQFDGSGNLAVRYFADVAQEPIATQGLAGATQWPLTDNLGTVHDVMGDNSAVLDHIVSDAFGQLSSQTNTSAQPWQGFGGGHLDPNTGEVLDGERRYDAITGGWTTRDPIGFGGGDANTGRYAANSPTNAIDPSGELADWRVQLANRNAADAAVHMAGDPAAPGVPWFLNQQQQLQDAEPGFFEIALNLAQNTAAAQYDQLTHPLGAI
ncbi:MAG: RHS repeat-associated core domain-containing protein, partial [Candidatus Saccharimonadales bacterium]